MRDFSTELYTRMVLREAMYLAVEELPTEKQRWAISLLIEWCVAHPDEPLNWTDVARLNHIPQSSLAELVGRAIPSFKKALRLQPTIVEWLSTGEVVEV